MVVNQSTVNQYFKRGVNGGVFCNVLIFNCL